MKVSKQNAVVVRRALDGWVSDGLISRDQRAVLSHHIEEQSFDWHGLTRYLVYGAIACFFVAVVSALADELFLELLRKLFNMGPVGRIVGLSALSSLFYAWGTRRRIKSPERIYTNEAIMFFGVLQTAGAIAQLGIHLETKRISYLTAIGLAIYGGVGFGTSSPLVWLFALLSAGSTFGMETGYVSGWGAYWFGMNYPIRFVAFGLVLTAAAIGFEKRLATRRLDGVTQAIGLFYLFMALWLMSIFGNFGDAHAWHGVRQYELFHWCIMFGLAGAAAVGIGLTRDDDMMRGFGVTFLAINIYTRYFEYFWDKTHKAVFFAVLGASLWVLGHKAERIWHGGRKPTDLTD